MAQGRAGRSDGRALVLTGGGARGAYQAGALRAIAEISGERTLPFPIVSGVSAGAINALFIAARADDFSEATTQLWDLWERLHTADVFVTRPTALFRIGARLLAELTLGAFIRERRINYLLDTRPLHQLVAANTSPVGRIQRHFAEGLLEALAVTATDYRSGNAVTFYDSRTPIEPWARTARLGVRAYIRPEHALASAALPMFFAPVEVDGRYFGDGGIRLTAPLSTVIHLRAERIMAIGTRYARPIEQVIELTRGPVGGEGAFPGRGVPTFADLGGVLLNALLLDGLEVDVERLERINRTLSLFTLEKREQQPLRVIPLTVLRPSRDLGQEASELLRRVPLPVRHLLKGLGSTEHAGWDLLSYLFFDNAYTSKLLQLGYADTMAERARIEQFFS
jgi:NTE family protein